MFLFFKCFIDFILKFFIFKMVLLALHTHTKCTGQRRRNVSTARSSDQSGRRASRSPASPWRRPKGDPSPGRARKSTQVHWCSTCSLALGVLGAVVCACDVGSHHCGRCTLSASTSLLHRAGQLHLWERPRHGGREYASLPALCWSRCPALFLCPRSGTRFHQVCAQQ